MIRLFETHKTRFSKELETGWTLSAKGKDYKVNVPGCWESIPDLNTYRGSAEYTTQIDVLSDSNVRLVFKGVSHTADVYFGGEFMVHHYNAYTEFNTVVKNVKAGKHTVKVIVDNSFSEESALHIPNDYYSYGGISRPVVFELVPDVFIENLHLIPVYENNTWKLNVKVYVQNLSDQSSDIYVSAEINDQTLDFGKKTVGAGVTLIEDTFAINNAEPWTRQNPNLYLVRAVIKDENGEVTDDLIERTGFRVVEIKGSDILINGESVYFKGLNRHEDHPQFGCAVPVAAMNYDLDLFDDLGANAVRTCHYPNDDRFLDLCDERGFYVWEENHARGIGVEDMVKPNFQPQCLDCIKEMVTAHINHPSIFIWGILNECGSESEFGRKCYSEQYDLLRALDPSRPVTSASCRIPNDICLDLPDVVSMNIYPQWYINADPGENCDSVRDWIQTTGGKDKPFILSEFGAGGIYGYRTPLKVKWSEERQSDILEEQITKFSSRDYINGLFIWQFCDCRVTEEVWFRTRPKTQNNKGVVDMYRRPKLAYETVKRLFKDL